MANAGKKMVEIARKYKTERRERKLYNKNGTKIISIPKTLMPLAYGKKYRFRLRRLNTGH